MQKPSLPKGTRDFAPQIMRKRLHVINTIVEVYRKYGFEPLETPAMENLSTLTGKYGDEGDKLLFKILNNGNFLEGLNAADFEAETDLNKITNHIAEKGLRYDLTVPLARFVVQNQHLISLPFKRYQIQPVWRADRPQKGRYREFWQCDADVIGTDSLLCEADFLLIYHEVFTRLHLNNYEVKINHRKILEAVAETIGYKGELMTLTVAIDKLDKIGWEGVSKELAERGFAPEQSKLLQELLQQFDFNTDVIGALEFSLKDSEAKSAGINAIKELLALLGNKVNSLQVKLDLSLARGLDYYTGVIFEALIHESGMGSVSGGGRYDNLTGVFGLPGVSGVGISFGLDRIFDIMENRSLFAGQDRPECKILLCHFDEVSFHYTNEIAQTLRDKGISAEVYPDIRKLKKQLDYANKRNFAFVGVAGSEEVQNKTIQLKDMDVGSQSQLGLNELIEKLR